MLSLKNRDIVNISSEKWGTEVVINRKDTSAVIHLSEVLNFLPAGFVYKEETGMGATTLEIFAERNSIIVEPIKITASSKADKHICLYVGSETKFHKKKSPSKKEINDYANDKSIKFKKIIVVADSLPKVIEALGDDVFKDYFLLIDEIDSFQLDSSYRKSMESCMEIYKKFNKENRAMLSATKIEFSDPILKEEPLTEMKYNIKKPRNISIITTNPKDIHGVVIDMISKIIINHPNDKLFIGYNSVNGCFNLAEHLVDKSIINKDEIKILCSSASKNVAKEYYNELNDNKLPGKVNFFTSAYFTGFDLIESYHLITISGNKSKIQALSDRRIKQIAGRSRTGLLSETIIHDIATDLQNNNPTENELIEAAKNQVDSHNCMKRHYLKNPFLKTFISDINEQFMKVLEAKNLRLVRNDEKGDFHISYLNIDAILEGLRVRKELYLDPFALTKTLSKNGEFVNHKVLFSKTIVKNKKASIQERDYQVEEIIDILKKKTSNFEIKANLKSGSYSGIQEKIAEDFLKVIDHIESNNILDLMKENIIGKRDLRAYNRLIKSALFHIAPNTQLTVSRFNIQFPLNSRFTTAEVLIRMKIALSESQISNDVKTEKNAMGLLNTFFKTYRKRDPKDGTDYVIIKENNPFGFNIIKTKKSMDENSIFSVIKSYL